MDLLTKQIFGAPHGEGHGLCPTEGATERLMCKNLIL